MKIKRKWFIWGGITLLILLIVLRRFQVIGSPPGIKVAVEEATLRNIYETVSASGKIQPVKEVKVSPDVSGEIVEIYVKEGQTVKKGDPLVRIKPDLYKANFDQVSANVQVQKANYLNSEARLNQAKSRLITLEQAYLRSKTLFEKGVISQAEYDEAYMQYLVAKAEVEAANQALEGAKFAYRGALASLNEASNNLSRTIVYAPLDGVISRLSVQVGERVAGASQFSPGTEILRIADLSIMEVQVQVNENEVVRIHVDDTAHIYVDAYPRQIFKGKVTDVSLSAINSTQITTAEQVPNFQVKIRIQTSDTTDQKLLFRPGMSATVDIFTHVEKNALTVPIQAVTSRSDLEKDSNNSHIPNEYVFVAENNRAILRKVKTGIQDQKYIVIQEGIKQGEKVIVSPYSAISKILKDGSRIRIVDKSKLFE
ncbi:MAG: efflux RND transporter periplasmic adaptor subunit [Bacteroidales bacterium]|nr:efflux RND transporter periplasmic adaptor subunit [Bacteroidales bacterium]